MAYLATEAGYCAATRLPSQSMSCKDGEGWVLVLCPQRLLYSVVAVPAIGAGQAAAATTAIQSHQRIVRAGFRFLARRGFVINESSRAGKNLKGKHQKG